MENLNQQLKDVIQAITSVKSRAKAALEAGDLATHAERMFDLFALYSIQHSLLLEIEETERRVA